MEYSRWYMWLRIIQLEKQSPFCSHKCNNWFRQGSSMDAETYSVDDKQNMHTVSKSQTYIYLQRYQSAFTVKKSGIPHLHQVTEPNVPNNGRNKQYLPSEVIPRTNIASCQKYLIWIYSWGNNQEDSTEGHSTKQLAWPLLTL